MILGAAHSLRRRLVTPWVVATLALSGCTTYLQPTTCDRLPRSPTGPQQGTTACGGIHDARFCDYVAVAVEGADCAPLGIVETKHFCVVTHAACIDTHYAVKDHNCRVAHYEKVHDSPFAEECPSDAPTFVNR